MSAAWWRAVLGAVVIVVPTACGGDVEPEATSASGVVTVEDPEETSTPTTVPEARPGAGGGTSTTTTPAPGTDGDPAVTVGAPRGFPDDFPRPDDARVVVGSTAIVREDRVLSIELTTGDDLDKVVAFYRDAIGDADFDRLFERVADDEQPPSADLRFETDDYLGDVFLVGTDGGTAIVLTATIPVD